LLAFHDCDFPLKKELAPDGTQINYFLYNYAKFIIIFGNTINVGLIPDKHLDFNILTPEHLPL